MLCIFSWSVGIVFVRRASKKNLDKREHVPIWDGFTCVQIDVGCCQEGSTVFGGVVKDHHRKVLIAAYKKDSTSVEPSME